VKKQTIPARRVCVDLLIDSKDHIRNSFPTAGKRIHMTGSRHFTIHAISAFLALTAVLSCYNCIQAAEVLHPPGKVLFSKYSTAKIEIEKCLFGIPIYLESNEDNRFLRADVYGVFDYPFGSVRDALQAPIDWCDIVSLHLNIKACTYKKEESLRLLTLYSGRKYYQPPSAAYKLIFRFHLAANETEYLNIVLNAEKGPFGTKDHLITLEAVPLDQERTFVHFSYAYSYGLMARMAMSSYFATIGHDKKGFSIINYDKKGNPVCSEGIRGAMERNAVRYYLALQTYIDTLKYPREQRFEKSINLWFDLTERYPQKLHEMDKEEYIAGKRREHGNQLNLQKEINK
jgi:hypothetical protein